MNCAARQGESALETPHAWRELTCQEYEDAIKADDEAHVASSITDPDGVYGSPLTFTLWLMSDGSYLSTALEGRRDTEDYKCSHAASVPVLETHPPQLTEIQKALDEASSLIEDRYADSGWPSNSWRIRVEKWRDVYKKLWGAPVEPVPAPCDEDFTCGGACEFHGRLWCKTFDRPCREYVTAVELEREQHDHQDTKGALEIVTDELNALKSRESAPVPAPRLEWTEPEDHRRIWSWKSGLWTIVHANAVTKGVWLRHGDSYLKHCESEDAAKSLAEKLNAVLSPPVGTQE